MSWASDIKKASDMLGININDMVRYLSLHIFTQVVQRTPVDEGYLRAAWNISLNKPVYITVPGDSGSNSLPKDLGWFPQVHITNGLPYAGVVEYGLYPGIGPKTVEGTNPTTGGGIFSRQAPVGMVEVTLASIEKFFSQIMTGAVS